MIATVYRKEYSSWMINEERSKLKTAQKRFRRGVCFINLTKPDRCRNLTSIACTSTPGQHLSTKSPKTDSSEPYGTRSGRNNHFKNHFKLLFSFTVQWQKHFFKAQILFIFFFFSVFSEETMWQKRWNHPSTSLFFLLYINWKKNLFHLIINLCRCVYHTQLGYAKNIVLKANIYQPLNVFTGITLNFSILLIGKK